MGIRYLLDTNIVSKYFCNQLEENITSLIENLVPEISVITQIELLSYTGFSTDEISIINEFISDAVVHELDSSVVKETVRLRRKYKIKTPDAIIAATAIINDLHLISYDTSFKNIKGLYLVQP
ncbi:MAG: PIN domain-containing protein [Chitinophagales bacterium]|jgi:predicted nucleic acid-binding protein|nr:PIN domain-containing protein [Sphingobacteriales bacterium]